MKKRLSLVAYLSLYFLVSASSQIEPPILSFQNLDVNWQHVTRDTNFSIFDSDPFATEYSNRFHADMLEDGGYIYVHQLVTSQQEYLGFEGSLVHKLDTDTGELLWTYHNNSYSGNTRREMFDVQSLALTDGNVQMLGYQDFFEIDFENWAAAGFHGRPIRKLLDPSTGALVAQTVSDVGERTGYNYAQFRNRVIQLGDGDIVNFSVDITVPDSTAEKKAAYYDIDDETMVLDSVETVLTAFDTGEASSNLDFPPFMLVDDNTMAILMTAPVFNIPDTPYANVVLQYVDVSSKEGVALLSETELIQDVALPQSAFSNPIQLLTTDDHVFVYQAYEVSFGDDRTWVSWYDKQGNRMSGIKDPTAASGQYYVDLYPAGVVEGAAYILAQRDNFAIDLLKLDDSAQGYEIIKEIRLVNPEATDGLVVDAAQFLSNNTLLMAAFTRDEQSQYTLYLNFSLESLGILTSSEDVEVDALAAYPNPTTGLLTVSLSDVDAGLLYVRSIEGRLIYTQQLRGHESTTVVDLADQPAGTYILQVVTEGGIDSQLIIKGGK